MVEVKLIDDYSEYMTASMELYWLARVIRSAGYRLLLRYVGMDKKGDDAYDFWVNFGSTDLRPVGFCAANTAARGLIPPEAIRGRHSDWSQYSLCQIHAFRTLIPNWPEIQAQKLSSCKFRKGMRVELLDSLVSMRVRLARVEDTVGSRVLVKVHKKDMSKTDLKNLEEDKDGDPQVDEGAWMDEESTLLFPVGWAMNVGYNLSACEEYVKRSKEIADAIKSGAASVPYAKNDARPELFKTYAEVVKDDNMKFREFKKGMKLEVLDPLDTWKEFRVATILDTLPYGYLKVGFDSQSVDEDPVPIHCSSPLLFPVGYSEKYGINLKGPKETSAKFSWNFYLRQTCADFVTNDYFEPLPDISIMEQFKIGAKLEAVDMCEPHLICAATVAAHKGRLLQIHYDGWEDSYDQYFDYRSSDIFPIGWCEMHGYKLEAPKIQVKKRARARNDLL